MRVAFTQEIEHKLNDIIIPYFRETYSSNDNIEFNCFKESPRTEKGRKTTEQNKGAYYLTDPEYFNISYIEFRLDKGDWEIHDEFWRDLREKLSE